MRLPSPAPHFLAPAGCVVTGLRSGGRGGGRPGGAGVGTWTRAGTGPSLPVS